MRKGIKINIQNVFIGPGFMEGEDEAKKREENKEEKAPEDGIKFAVMPQGLGEALGGLRDVLQRARGGGGECDSCRQLAALKDVIFVPDLLPADGFYIMKAIISGDSKGLQAQVKIRVGEEGSFRTEKGKEMAEEWLRLQDLAKESKRKA